MPIDINDVAHAAEAKELKTTTKVETVNRALDEIASRRARLAFLEEVRGADDDLGDSAVMSNAWR